MSNSFDTPIQRREQISLRSFTETNLRTVPVTAEHVGIDLPPLDTRTHAQARTEAARIIEEARQTAKQMVEHARSVRDSELADARLEGYRIGYEEGLEAADREAAGLISTAETIATNVATERQRLLEESEGEIVDLALHIAERIVNQAIDVEPELVVEVCRGAMRKAFQRETLLVLAHPDDLEMLRAAGPEIARELGGVRQLDVVEERRLQPGSIIVRTPAGEIDATLDGKLAVVRQHLLETAEARRASMRGGTLPLNAAQDEPASAMDEAA
jgi:flagellar assembly protein FliH